ncbi:hypothetical protein CVT25_005309 [Psilocybe cyanescens]|uniref:Uncharacterized protein n=1 Tax=Psilocybe cyanescens TaxID=93625 RepID=A0A409XBZ3_PSICY|nr:hypothetical protein CVT25_005309 [Psilocybe cyanescens]
MIDVCYKAKSWAVAIYNPGKHAPGESVYVRLEQSDDPSYLYRWNTHHSVRVNMGPSRQEAQEQVVSDPGHSIFIETSAIHCEKRGVSSLDIQPGAMASKDEDDNVEAPLSITACQNLTKYSGPGYYANAIEGRPVTVPVEEFWVRDWPTYALPNLFPIIINIFPHLTELYISFSPYSVINRSDLEDIEFLKKIHYLSVIQDSSTGEYEVPETLRYLEILLDEQYKKHQTITLAQVMGRIQSSERFANLESIIFGNEKSYQFWRKDETGVRSMMQQSEDDLDGEDGDASSNEYSDNDYSPEGPDTRENDDGDNNNG